jgi:acyl carrier protein
MNRLTILIARHLGIEEHEVTPEARFKEDLGADFIDVADLMVQAEDLFDITISADEEESVLRGTVGRFIEVVRAKGGAGAVQTVSPAAFGNACRIVGIAPTTHGGKA